MHMTETTWRRAEIREWGTDVAVHLRLLARNASPRPGGGIWTLMWEDVASCEFQDARVRGPYRKRSAGTTGRWTPVDVSHKSDVVELSLTFSRRSAVAGSLRRWMMSSSLSWARAMAWKSTPCASSTASMVMRDSASATWLSFPAMWRTSVVYSLIAESWFCCLLVQESAVLRSAGTRESWSVYRVKWRPSRK